MKTGVVEGVVKSVSVGKGEVTNKMGTFARLNVVITPKDGGEDVKVNRLVKPGNDGSKLVGKKVKVTYTEKEVETESGDTFISRSTDSKGFVLLDEAPYQPRSQTGSQSIPVAGRLTDKERADGARHGMIVNNAVALAEARGDLSLNSLKQAAVDVVTLTQFVEGGALSSGAGVADAVKVVVGTKTKKVVVDDEEPPFDNE